MEEVKNGKSEADEHPNRCRFYVARKRRYCKLTRITGHEYCGEHYRPSSDPENGGEEEAKRRRIVCPLDPKHTCYESKLASHLKKCNAREGEKPAFYSANVNSGEDDFVDGGKSSSESLQLGKLSDEQLLAFLKKIKTAYASKKSIREKERRPLSHRGLGAELEKMRDCAGATKHLSQSASILGNMERLGILSRPGCFVELGAGRGGMSFWLSRILALPGRESVAENSVLLLVDRASQRHKLDNRLKDGPEAVDGLDVVRVKADLEHLVLDKLLEEKCPQAGASRGRGRLVAFSKHLCGAATDFALRCLVGSGRGVGSLSVCLATCCHHRCEWKAYVGKAFFKALGFDASEFRLVCSLTSWLTCGLRKHLQEGSVPEPEAQADRRYTKLGLSVDDREEVGRMCKDLIDLGRLDYLSDNGFPSISWCEYIAADVTPENVVLIAESDVGS